MTAVVVLGTGPIPDGADAVVQVEDTEQLAAAPDGAKRVRISARVAEGHDVRTVVCQFFDTVLACLTTSFFFFFERV
jgi:gephyrin